MLQKKTNFYPTVAKHLSLNYKVENNQLNRLPAKLPERFHRPQEEDVYLFDDTIARFFTVILNIRKWTRENDFA